MSPAPMLDAETIRRRLTVNSPELVQELFTIVQGLLAAEVGRQTRLDTKATSLLTAAGLTLTVASGFASTVITHPELVAKWQPQILTLLVLVFVLDIVLGLVAAVSAVRALKVRGGYRTADEESLFNEELLEEANGPSDLPPEDEVAMRVFGLMHYRKALIPHYWEILEKHRAVHDEKAKLIEQGQGFFLAFLGALLMVCILVAVGVLSRG